MTTRRSSWISSDTGHVALQELARIVLIDELIDDFELCRRRRRIVPPHHSRNDLLEPRLISLDAWPCENLAEDGGWFWSPGLRNRP
jgi:hypothetical protein